MQAKSRWVGPLLFLSILLALVATPAQSSTQTTYYLPSVSSTAIIEECRDYTYGLDYDDNYGTLTLHSSPLLNSLPSQLKIEVYFSQSCSILKNKYTRNVSLIRPDGNLIPLAKDPRQSWSSESRYSVYCNSTSCWGHNDVYLLNPKDLPLAGDYGLRFTTNYQGVVCNSVSGAFVCESNVSFEKVFDLPKLFTLTAATVPSPSATPVPTASPSPAQSSNVPLALLDSVRLTGFSGKSTSLSTAHKRAIDGMLLGNAATKKVVCTSLNSKSATLTQKVMSRKRALAACNYALVSNRDLQISTNSKLVSTRSLFGGVLISAEG